MSHKPAINAATSSANATSASQHALPASPRGSPARTRATRRSAAPEPATYGPWRRPSPGSWTTSPAAAAGAAWSACSPAGPSSKRRIWRRSGWLGRAAGISRQWVRFCGARSGRDRVGVVVKGKKSRRRLQSSLLRQSMPVEAGRRATISNGRKSLYHNGQFCNQ